MYEAPSTPNRRSVEASYGTLMQTSEAPFFNAAELDLGYEVAFPFLTTAEPVDG